MTAVLMQYPSAAPKNRALVVLGAQWGDEGKVREFYCPEIKFHFLQFYYQNDI